MVLLLHKESCNTCFCCCSFRADVHTEAVQAALAKYKERKMPMPSKRRSVLTHTAVEAYTPPGTGQGHGGLGGVSRWGGTASDCREECVCGCVVGGGCRLPFYRTSVCILIFSLRCSLCLLVKRGTWSTCFME